MRKLIHRCLTPTITTCAISAFVALAERNVHPDELVTQ